MNKNKLNAKLLRESEAKNPFEKGGPPGWQAQFLCKTVLGLNTHTALSDFYLFRYGNWYVKYRITFPVKEREFAEPATEKLVTTGLVFRKVKKE